jgi:hypothetical protein
MIAFGYMKKYVAASKEQPRKEARGPVKNAATLHSNTRLISVEEAWQRSNEAREMIARYKRGERGSGLE